MAEQVVDLINGAKLTSDAKEKETLLTQTTEILFHQAPTLLREFYPLLLEFESDSSPVVRKFTAGLVEDCCKRYPEYLPSSIETLVRLSKDQNPNVLKRVILSATNLYKIVLEKILREGSNAVNEKMWKDWTFLKNDVIGRMTADGNDGIITQALKFVETIILCYTWNSKANSQGFSINMIPNQHPILSPQNLMAEGETLLDLLTAFLNSKFSNTTSTAIIIVNSLATIIKQRTQLLSKLLPVLLQFHQESSKKYTTAIQISSIQHTLRTLFFAIARLGPEMLGNWLDDIHTALRQLGVKDSRMKRKNDQVNNPARSDREKKIKETQPEQMPEMIQAAPANPIPQPLQILMPGTPPIGNNLAEFLLASEFTLEMIIDVIMDCLNNPPILYQPENVMGNPMMNGDPRQMMNNVIDPRMDPRQIGTMPSVDPRQPVMESRQTPMPPVVDPRANPISNQMEPPSVPEQRPLFKKDEEPRSKLPINRPKVEEEPMEEVRIERKPYKMTIFPNSVYKQIYDTSLERILNSEKGVELSGHGNFRRFLIAKLASKTEESSQLFTRLQRHIVENFVSRKELAIDWLFEEMETFQEDQQSRYLQIFVSILKTIPQDVDVESFSFYLTQAPILPPEAFQLIDEYCGQQQTIRLGLSTLKDLIVLRPNYRMKSLDILLKFSSNQDEKIRSPAIRLIVNRLYNPDLGDSLSRTIEDFATKLLNSINQQPASEQEMEWEEASKKQTEEDEIVKQSMFLYFALCTKNHALLEGILDVYVSGSATVRSVIHSQASALIKTIAISPALFHIVQTFPRKSEPLVLQFLDTLTESEDNLPPELVSCVMQVYERRTGDARFLVPIIQALSKDQILSHLPKIMALTSSFIKNTMNRLIQFSRKITPQELLMSLHTSDTKDPAQMKKVIEAIQVFFEQKANLKPEVFAIVLQQLVDISPTPPLLMRTIIQTLAKYPKLMSFIMTILSTLIVKQVWNDKLLWEGFVKCCKMAEPHSLAILVKLPPIQLENAVKMQPEMREPIKDFARKNNIHLKANI